MASHKQNRANRRNALASTGPRTLAGKRKVSRNALKHGLLAKDLVIRGESRADWEAFRDDLLEDLAPQRPLERLLADHLVASAWRLRRAARYEKEILERSHRQEQFEREADPEWFADQPELSMADSVLDCFGGGTYSKMVRYEAFIQRSMYRALDALQRLQADRAVRLVPPPLAVVVDVEVEATGPPQEA